jgi:hypothetical protein
MQIFAAAGENRDIDAARWSGEAVRGLVTRSIPVEALAGVAELVDAPDLGSGDESRGGSSPFARTSAACVCRDRPGFLGAGSVSAFPDGTKTVITRRRGAFRF